MSTTGATFSSQLASIAGSGNVISDSAELTAYEIDGKAPAAAVRPESSEQVAEIVKFAVAEKLAIVASGARTKLAMGMPPRQYDLAIDTTRLTRVIAYDPNDLTLGVEAGISLREVARLLAEHRQFLPLATPFADQATIGGTIASGVDGPLRQFYGTARDYVLGMEFVAGDGAVAKSGGRVVKNVAGYDIHKVMIGALGTLGVVTRVNFRTFPVPVSMRACVATFESAENALDLRRRLAQTPFTPSMLEILSPRAARMLSSNRSAPMEKREVPTILTGSSWAVVTGIAGNEKVIERFEREFKQMAEQSGPNGVRVLGEDDTRAILGRMREFVPIVLASSPAATLIKMSVLPARMNELLTAAARAADANSLEWAASARGLGVIYFALLANERNEEMRHRVVQTTEQIFAECSRLEANVTIPWCPGEWKGALKVWGPDRSDFDLMRKVKNAFDPNSVFSPGRFMGGL